MNKSMIKAGVIGWPINHSLSPFIHNYWLNKYTIRGEYTPFAVKPSDFETFVLSLSASGTAGINVTLPHKESAYRLVNFADENARRIGAVNTIVFQSGGKLYGSNTDGYGFVENLRANAPDWNAKSGPAVVLGSGGASRAIIASLQDEGISEIRLLNRTKGKAKSVKKALGNKIYVYDWNVRSDVLSDASILVNCTSLGMTGQPNLEIDLGKLPNDSLVYDIVYTPIETQLLLNAKKKGNVVIDGLGMLLHQARPGFAAWFGVSPEVTKSLRNYILELIRN